MNIPITMLCIAYFLFWGIMAYGDIKHKDKFSKIGGWGIVITVTLLVIIALIVLT